MASDQPTFHDIATGNPTGIEHSHHTESAPAPASPDSERAVNMDQQHKDSQTTLARDASASSAEHDKISPEQAHALSAADLEKQEMDLEGVKIKDNEMDTDPTLVTWNGPDDPECAQNFPTYKKWVITLLCALNTFTCTFASSVFSTAAVPTSKEFHVSTVTMTLGTSLFVLGFAFGPIVFGPLSELYGRKYPLFIGMFVFGIFNIPVAVTDNLQTIMICRFFGGFFASAPLAVIGGCLSDMFDPVNRGVAVAIFATGTFIGPVLGPIIGGFIVDSYLGWRWTQWITLIMALAFAVLSYPFIPETYPPVLLHRRAKRLRHETKNWALHSKDEEEEIDLREITEQYLLRPFKMLVLEPILLLITLYIGFIYGFLYLCFEAFPVAFQEYRGWNDGVGALPFLAVGIGIFLAAGGLSWFTKTRFRRKFEEQGKLVPEERLIPMMVGSFLLPAGMFWFGWTSSPHILWVPEVLSGIAIGAGVMLIFMQGLNYIIDVYAACTNSALAANTLFRSLLGAGFPMFASGMFHNLGVAWAMSLLGFLCIVLLPVPFVFYIYGERIRKMSKYTPKTPTGD